MSYEQGETEGISEAVSAMAITVPVAIYIVAVGFLHAHPGRPKVISWATGVAAVLILADSFAPAPLYLTAGVLAVLVAVITVTTRTLPSIGALRRSADRGIQVKRARQDSNLRPED